MKNRTLRRRAALVTVVALAGSALAAPGAAVGTSDAGISDAGTSNDRDAPAITAVNYDKVVLGKTARFAWQSDDGEAAGEKPRLVLHDVRYSFTDQRAARMSRTWRTPSGLQGIARRYVRLPVRAGRVTCVQVRGRDAAGNVSAWQYVNCIGRPYDDRALERRGKTRRVGGDRNYLGTATRIHRGGRLVLRKVRRDSHVFVVYKGNKGGAGGLVKVPGTSYSTFGRHGARRYRQIFHLPVPLQTRKGPVVVKRDYGYGNRTLVIDGLAVLPPWVRRVTYDEWYDLV
ncbi:hypothetical protein [Mumia zhuanghuii]|uniref:Uncharacterized protein n=1 Tax=Mumia zhuanghuii TaxID=2585211 RepID=A0A5C4MDT9_9ACTN|nr:hypothetical protein [Mumia zhuanghuii]TNC32823.1 hypothetical protein FHE65_30120 [Mumia zhuanghuii]TNC43748.1 hypothetical protein FHE65_17530 [Mumia zhuanghuii]